jgi:AsmA protein
MTDHPTLKGGLRHDGGQPRRLGPGRPPPPLPRSGEPAPTLRPRRRRRRWLQLTGYLFLGLACMLVGSITFLLIAAPVDFVRDQMIQQVKAHTGRDLVIAGPTSIALFPQVSVHLADVTLSEPPGMGSAPLLTAQSFTIDVPLLSLLSRQFAVKRLLLVHPTIELRIDAQGQRNWSFARAPGGAQPAPDAGPREPTLEPIARATKRSGVAPAFDQLSLENVHISDGTLRVSDERKSALKEITAINVTLSLADLAGPLQGKGSFAWNGEKVAFDGKLSPARALLGEQKGRVVLALTSQLLEAAYDGALALGPAPSLEGKATLKAASLGALGAWLGRRVAADAGALDVSAMLSLDQGRLAITDLSGVAGGGTLSGTLALEMERARPYLSGTLRTTDLDLGRLLLRPEAASLPGTPSRPGAAERPGNAEPEPAPAAKAPPPLAAGKRRAVARWSEAPLDLAPLRLADADVTIVVDRLLYRELETGQSQLALALKDEVAKLTLQDTLLYGGRGRGVLTFDASGQEPATTTELVLDNVLYRPLLRDALGLEWLTGRGKITLSLSGQGQSERKIVETLKGKAELVIGNGEFAGIDVGKLLRAIEQAQFNRLEVSPEDRTPFNELAGTFHINNGLAETNDLRLVGPHLRLSGTGSTNLVERSADYVVRLKLAETAPHEGAVIKVSGLEFPMHITGPWEKLAFKPDLKGIVNSEQASEAIRQIGKNLNTPEVREAVKGLLSGDGQQRPKARELLEKLLKKQ